MEFEIGNQVNIEVKKTLRITFCEKDRPSAKPRIYVWPCKESIIDNLRERHSRPFQMWKDTILPMVFQALNINQTTKVTWSQYAGCSCPCSPGFILDGYFPYDIHVHIDADGFTTSKQEAEREAALTA